MKVLITGINGFVGSHLTEYLTKEKECEIFGIVRHRSNLSNIDEIKSSLKVMPVLIEGNIVDSHSVNKVIQEVQPDKIFHLAAQSFVPYSWSAPQETFNVNVQGTINILEAVKKYSPASIVMLAGTSEEYGLVTEKELPIKETHQLKPLSPYGVSKVATDLLGWMYFRSYGVKVVRTRAFNHEGPRRGREFVISQFIEQALKVKYWKSESIKVGCLDTTRDFTDVRDIVKAYWLATEKCEYGEVYNICSGVGIQIQAALSKVIDCVFGPDFKDKIKVEFDDARKRPADVPILVGDSTKFRDRTKWKTEIPFEKTIADMVEYIRAKVKNNNG